MFLLQIFIIKFDLLFFSFKIKTDDENNGMQISDISKFINLGVTASINSMARAFPTINHATAHIATRAPLPTHQVLKAVEAIADPVNMNWIQGNPGTALAALSLTIGSALGGAMYYALKDNIDGSKKEDDNLFNKHINSLRERFMSTSLGTNSNLKI